MNNGKIVIAAHLEMCQKCHLHGVIVYSDKSRSEQLFTQEEGVRELESAQSAGLLIPAEIPELRRQVNSRLPPQLVAYVLGYSGTKSKRARDTSPAEASEGRPHRSLRHPACDKRH